MPGYAGAGQAKLLRTNQQVFLFNNETVAAGTSSIAVELERISRSFYPWGVSLEISFSGAPGGFEVDVQTADTDSDTHYVSETTTVTAVNANNVGRIELTQFWARFLRVNIKTLGSAVATTVLLTR